MTTVVVAIGDNGARSYQSLVPGGPSPTDRERADQVSDRVGSVVDEFVARTKLIDIVQNRIEQYWLFGTELQKLLVELEVKGDSERNLFFANVRMHMNRYNDLFPKDDPKRKRIIPAQFFKLAGYPIDLATCISWSQWSYLFDNVYIMESTGFDAWFKPVLESGRYAFNEGFTRLWAESFNATFRNVDLSAWSEEEFVRSLQCTLDVTQNIVDLGVNISSRDTRRLVRLALNEALLSSRSVFIRMLMGEVPEKEYIISVTEKVAGRLEVLKVSRIKDS